MDRINFWRDTHISSADLCYCVCHSSSRAGIYLEETRWNLHLGVCWGHPCRAQAEPPNAALVERGTVRESVCANLSLCWIVSLALSCPVLSCAVPCAPRAAPAQPGIAALPSPFLLFYGCDLQSVAGAGKWKSPSLLNLLTLKNRACS